jgi:tRNA (guanine10-N2)-methyltransferase
MTEYLIRLVQVHESFRKPEILALATLADISVEVLSYDEFVCPSPHQSA